jgi:anthranilate synthase component 2/para-aminobenzoate synthetase component 2
VNVLLIDNNDSFTWNLAQLIASLGVNCRVLAADAATPSIIQKFKPEKIVLSPGPHRPEDAKRSLEIIKTYTGKLPILGVCLGHQCLALAFGGTVTHAPVPMHGKTSEITHTSTHLFRGVPSPFTAARYHSLIVKMRPPDFELLAWTHSLSMSIKHKTLPIVGVQFHPESFLTKHGATIMKNFLTMHS